MGLVSGIKTEHLMVCVWECLYSRLLMGGGMCDYGGLTGLLWDCEFGKVASFC